MNLMKTDNLYQNEENQNTGGKKLWTVRRIFSRFGFAYLLFFVMMALTQILMTALLTPLQPYLGDNGVQMIVMLSVYVLAAPICYLAVKKIPKGSLNRTEKPGVGGWLLIFVISMGCAYGGNIIGQLLMGIWSMVRGSQVQNDVLEMVETMGPISVLLPAVIVGPVMEELLFRKLLLDRIVCYGEVRAILLSGFLFGLAHGNFFQFFYAFMLGCVFAYVYLRTGSFWYVASFHMAVNFMGSVAPMALLKLMEQTPVAGTFAMAGWGMWILGFLGCGIFLAAYLWRSLVWFPPSVEIPKKKWAASVFLNVGMGLFLLYCAASLIISVLL